MSTDEGKTVFDQRHQTVQQQTNISGEQAKVDQNQNYSAAAIYFGRATSILEESELSANTKQEMSDALAALRAETAKGEGANTSLVERLLRTLVEQIPDLAEVLLAALLDPALGAAASVKFVARKTIEAVGKKRQENG